MRDFLPKNSGKTVAIIIVTILPFCFFLAPNVLSQFHAPQLSTLVDRLGTHSIEREILQEFRNIIRASLLPWKLDGGISTEKLLPYYNFTYSYRIIAKGNAILVDNKAGVKYGIKGGTSWNVAHAWLSIFNRLFARRNWINPSNLSFL